MEKLLYSRIDAARMLSISVDTLDRLAENGYIKRLHIGSRCYYTPEALTAFLGRLVNRGGVDPQEVA